MKKYNHAFDIAFSIDSDNEGGLVTEAELLTGLLKRVIEMLNGGDIVEACGLPFDTLENEEEEI